MYSVLSGGRILATITSRGHPRASGGDWSSPFLGLRASHRDLASSTLENGTIGFRVASMAVPEPTTIALTVLALDALPVRRRKLVPHNRT
jgi:hypothetical protein